MATEEELEEAIENLIEVVQDVANDTRRFTQVQSLRIYEATARYANDWAAQIKKEMG